MFSIALAGAPGIYWTAIRPLRPSAASAAHARPSAAGSGPCPPRCFLDLDGNGSEGRRDSEGRCFFFFLNVFLFNIIFVVHY